MLDAFPCLSHDDSSRHTVLCFSRQVGNQALDSNYSVKEGIIHTLPQLRPRRYTRGGKRAESLCWEYFPRRGKCYHSRAWLGPFPPFSLAGSDSCNCSRVADLTRFSPETQTVTPEQLVEPFVIHQILRDGLLVSSLSLTTMAVPSQKAKDEGSFQRAPLGARHVVCRSAATATLEQYSVSLSGLEAAAAATAPSSYRKQTPHSLIVRGDPCTPRPLGKAHTSPAKRASRVKKELRSPRLCSDERALPISIVYLGKASPSRNPHRMSANAISEVAANNDNRRASA